LAKRGRLAVRTFWGNAAEGPDSTTKYTKDTKGTKLPREAADAVPEEFDVEV
jgi:hypothetical protein